MSRRPFRLSIAQINTTVGDLDGNRQKILNSLRQAAREGSRLVTFPELAITGYPPEDILFKEHFISKNLSVLKSLVPATKGLSCFVGFVDRDERGLLYNAAAFIVDGKLAVVYRKTRLPNYGVFDEKRYFSEGGEGLVVESDLLRVGFTICEDIWQKDTYVYNKLFCDCVSLIVNISASPYHKGKQVTREDLVSKLAKHNRTWVLYHNLVGGQDELVFDGGSLLMNPIGEVWAQARRFEEDLMTVDVPLAPPNKRSFPRKIQASFLKLRDGFFIKGKAMQKAPPAPIARMSEEEEVYKALVVGTRDYVQKNRFKNVLVGLSGGIDSALVAQIAVDALGAAQVVGITMPSPYTSAETLQDAHMLARNLNITAYEIPISPIMESYANSLKGVFTGQKTDTTEENLQARIRGNLLMAYSNKFGYLVLTTGNKSEMATGYCTLYGDMAGGFAVLKDVPKTLVFRLARFRNAQGGHSSIPESTLKRPPTAELRANQKDQDSLPPYDLLDKFLELYVEKDLSIRQIVKRGIPEKVALRTASLVDGNEYKRRQSPPGVKITPKAFGRDRRMPITNRFKQ